MGTTMTTTEATTSTKITTMEATTLTKITTTEATTSTTTMTEVPAAVMSTTLSPRVAQIHEDVAPQIWSPQRPTDCPSHQWLNPASGQCANCVGELVPTMDQTSCPEDSMGVKDLEWILPVVLSSLGGLSALVGCFRKFSRSQNADQAHLQAAHQAEAHV